MQSAPQHVLPADLPEVPPGGVDPTQSQLEGHVNGNQHSLQNRAEESFFQCKDYLFCSVHFMEERAVHSPTFLTFEVWFLKAKE